LVGGPEKNTVVGCWEKIRGENRRFPAGEKKFTTGGPGRMSPDPLFWGGKKVVHEKGRNGIAFVIPRGFVVARGGGGDRGSQWGAGAKIYCSQIFKRGGPFKNAFYTKMGAFCHKTPQASFWLGPPRGPHRGGASHLFCIFFFFCCSCPPFSPPVGLFGFCGKGKGWEGHGAGARTKTCGAGLQRAPQVFVGGTQGEGGISRKPV